MLAQLPFNIIIMILIKDSFPTLYLDNILKDIYSLLVLCIAEYFVETNPNNTTINGKIYLRQVYNGSG